MPFSRSTSILFFADNLTIPLQTFNADVVEAAVRVREAVGCRRRCWLVDGEGVDDVLADLVLDAAVSGLGPNTRGITR